MRTRESEEMYLETILILQGKKKNVRSIDVVEEINYAKSSVSRAVNLLEKKGYIRFDEFGYIHFTEEGKKRAEDVYEKHNVLTAFFQKIGATPESADYNACRIEHVISPDMFDLIKNYCSETK